VSMPSLPLVQAPTVPHPLSIISYGSPSTLLSNHNTSRAVEPKPRLSRGISENGSIAANR
jgi:hypothetical protein